MTVIAKQADVVAKHRFPYFPLSIFQKRQFSTVYPMLHSGEYSQPEGKRERYERSRRALADAQRQREVLQLDLGQRECSAREFGNDLDSEVSRLRRQIEELTRRMEDFELIRQDDLEAYAPPDYYSRSAESNIHY
ncbi:hypothetical protein BDZ94DRAFT_1315526 [Collybia nuda]|uniref:Uncharacterized protein n=1 Tax=Collybia nuda TaxID=64659 RepID=A0A9P5XSK5_9AGAR|nr:hypothetical protein BDZ94DRAFT_1315526 [Collybia nuda]